MIVEWKYLFDKELQQATKAREDKNEGRARVCARRAAGIAVGEYFRRQGIPLDTPSAYDRIKLLISMPGVASQVKEIAQHLIIRVNQNHNLPVEADLIADTRWLMQNLLEK